MSKIKVITNNGKFENELRNLYKNGMITNSQNMWLVKLINDGAFERFPLLNCIEVVESVEYDVVKER